MRALFAVLLFGAPAAAAEPLHIPAAAEYSAARGETALLVWQGGRMVYQRSSGRSAPAPRVFSITKSLVSIGVFRDARNGGFLHQPAKGLLHGGEPRRLDEPDWGALRRIASFIPRG